MVITPLVVAGAALCGAASAFGAWCFHRLFRERKHLAVLEARVDALEGK